MLVYGKPAKYFIHALKWVCQHFSDILLKSRTKEKPCSQTQKNPLLSSLWPKCLDPNRFAFWAAKEGQKFTGFYLMEQLGYSTRTLCTPRTGRIGSNCVKIEILFLHFSFTG